jgi:YHS domain-containing protein
MKSTQILGAIVVVILLMTVGVFANDPAEQVIRPQLSELEEANTFSTDDGTKYFICPVKGKPTPIDEAVAVSVVDEKRFYHCCISSQATFRADPAKHLAMDFFVPANFISYGLNGASFRDPVTGQTKVLKPDSPSHQIELKRYFFANEESKAAFVENPDQYIKAMQ